MWTFTPHSRRLALSLAQLESVISERTAELQKLSQRLLKVQDEERRKLARDLHDSNWTNAGRAQNTCFVPWGKVQPGPVHTGNFLRRRFGPAMVLAHFFLSESDSALYLRFTIQPINVPAVKPTANVVATVSTRCRCMLRVVSLRSSSAA